MKPAHAVEHELGAARTRRSRTRTGPEATVTTFVTPQVATGGALERTVSGGCHSGGESGGSRVGPAW